MEETKKKNVYSKNEKILRIVCIVAIVLSLIIGVLLFPLGKVVGGITVLCTSTLAAFLLSGFFVAKYKSRFKDNPNRRFIYAGLYAFILVLSLLTAFIMSYYTSFDKYEMEAKAREHAINTVKTVHLSIDGEISTDLFHTFDSSDSYYFSYELNFYVKEPGGASLPRSINKYVKVNKYTADVSFVDAIEYDRELSYVN